MYETARNLCFSETLRFPLNPDESFPTHDFNISHHPSQGDVQPSCSITFTPIFFPIEPHRGRTELGQTVLVSLGADEFCQVKNSSTSCQDNFLLSVTRVTRPWPRKSFWYNYEPILTLVCS